MNIADIIGGIIMFCVTIWGIIMIYFVIRSSCSSKSSNPKSSNYEYGGISDFGAYNDNKSEQLYHHRKNKLTSEQMKHLYTDEQMKHLDIKSE